MKVHSGILSSLHVHVGNPCCMLMNGEAQETCASNGHIFVTFRCEVAKNEKQIIYKSGFLVPTMM
jgi:hypothetical protein